MKILFVSQYFPPEGAPPASRIGECSVFWAQEGHDVQILTGFPNYPNGRVQEAYRSKLRRLIYREQWKGVSVVRVWLWALPITKTWQRALYYLSFCFSALLVGLFLRKPDIVVATSPPPFVALAGFIIARIKRVPFVFEVRDLWPESLTALQAGAPQSMMTRVITWIVRPLYRHSDHIVVVSPAFVARIHEDWQVPLDRIFVVENGILPDFFSPDGPRYQLPADCNAEGKFVACYSGTIGVAHGLGTILDAAAMLLDRPQVLFLLVGEGPERQILEQDARKRNLTNVHFLGLLPREDIPAVLRSCDVAMVLLKKVDAFKTVIPSKMLEMMGCALPLILGVDGQGKLILDAADAGISIEPENARELADAILTLVSDPEATLRYGKNGRGHVLQHYSREVLAGRYARILAKVIADAHGP